MRNRLALKTEGNDLDARDIHDELRLVTEFTVTEDHLKLLRRAYVGWDDCEFGAPAIDCKRPYGNSDVLNDMTEILGTPDEECRDEEGEILPDAEAALTRLHAETGVALQIALATGEFRTGRYVSDKYSANWRLDAAPALTRPDALRESARRAHAEGRITRDDLEDRLRRIGVMEQQDRDAGN
jgi:hypothetical protein